MQQFADARPFHERLERGVLAEIRRGMVDPHRRVAQPDRTADHRCPAAAAVRVRS
jgi:hypothetical protein